MYYSCKNPECEQRPSIREEKLVELAGLVFELIKVPKKVCEMIRALLEERLETDAKATRAKITQLRQIADRGRRRLERLYLDRLDDAIEERTWLNVKADVEESVHQAEAEISKLDGDTGKAYRLGVDLLELSKRAPELYRKASIDQKRSLLAKVAQRIEFDGERITPILYPEFEALAAIGWPNVRSSKRIVWLPHRDSNPNLRYQKPLSYH